MFIDRNQVETHFKSAKHNRSYTVMIIMFLINLNEIKLLLINFNGNKLEFYSLSTVQLFYF